MLGMGKNTVEIIIAAKDRTSAAFVKVNTQMKTMKASSGRLGGAMNSLKGGFSKVTSSLGSFGAALGPVGIAAAAVGVAMVTLGGAAIKASLDFEKAVATIRVGTGATGEALAGLEESFKTVFTAVPTTAANAATAIADLNTRLGLTGEPLEAAATQFLNLSRITGTDVSSAISSATRVMHDFAVSTEDQAQSLDYLFKVSQSTGIGITNLANNMTRYGGVMRQMGFDINESAALLGKFEKEGVNLELVLSSLRMGLANFARAGEEPVAALERVITEIQGMGSAADRNLKAIEIFGARSGPDMAAAIYEGRFSITELMATLDASSETINKAAEDTLTFGDKWTLLKNNILTALEPIGSAILNVLGGAMEGAGKAFNILKDAVEAVKTALEPLTSKIEELRKKFAGGIDTAQLFSDIIVILTEGARILGEKIVGLLKDALTPFVKKLEDAIAMLTAFYDKLGPIKTLIEGVKGVFGKAVEDVHEFAASIKEAKKPTEELEEAIDDVGEAAEKAIEPAIKKTEEAIEKQKEFTVTIGDTTIEFKGMAAEVVKNADAYEKLQKSAQTLIDLDWDTFIEFEAALPNINTGIGNLESSFVGFKDVLDTNIDKLENVKLAVMDISEIAAPFLEKGFLEGIKAIGNFAGALSDAGDAINTFAGLQEVSIEGCINFSMHVYDMVSALEILESQMEDLVPSFKRMDLLIDDIKTGFLSGIDVTTLYGEEWEHMQKWFSNTVIDVRLANETMAEAFGLTVEEIKILRKEGSLTTFAFMKQTSALKTQTGQLNRITEALQPYLEFMRTLNELTALSTLSTEELNSGLNAINDTLINLGTSLSTFDLRPVMESLFGTKTLEGKFTGGIAKGFTDTMQEYQGEFKMLIDYISRLSFAITSLTFAFDALANVSKSVLADETKLKDLFGEIDGIMGNFSKVMGEGEFAKIFAADIEKMLKTAGPLISYFQENNTAVKLFNSTLTTFTTTIKNVVDTMAILKRMSEMVLPTVTELEAGFGKVEVAISRFTKAISTSFADVKTKMVELDKEWAIHEEGIDKLLESFSAATNTITTLSSEIITLSATLKELKDMSVLSMRDIDEALKKIPLFLDRFVDALRLNMYDIKESLKDLHVEWEKHADDMMEIMPSYEASTGAISKLVSSLLSLHSALESLSEIGIITSTEFDRGFKSLMTSISNFAVSLSNNVEDLIYSLQKLRVVWVENEAVLFPLIRDFAIITDNLWGVAHNANRMAEEFNNLSENAGTLEKGFKSLIDFINQVVDSTEEFYTPEAAAELAGFIEDVEAVIRSFVDLEIELNGAMENIERAIRDAVGDAKDEINSFGPLMEVMYNSGVNLIQSLINGIAASIPALTAQMVDVADVIEGYLKASSPTRLGPLSDLDTWGPNLMNAYVGGLGHNMGSGGNRTVYLNVTQNISDRDTADYANHELQRLLSRNAVM